MSRLRQKQRSSMQFKNDSLQIRILNDHQDYQLVDQPGPNGVNLSASLVARVSDKPFESDDLGRVEIRASVYPFGAFLAMKINGESAAGAELVWDSFVSQDAWAAINQLHQALIGDAVSVAPGPPPSNPWLGIAFFPNLYHRLSPEQRAIAIAALWGRSYSIRQRARASVVLN
jgi:hypothetical protein